MTTLKNNVKIRNMIDFIQVREGLQSVLVTIPKDTLLDNGNKTFKVIKDLVLEGSINATADLFYTNLVLGGIKLPIIITENSLSDLTQEIARVYSKLLIESIDVVQSFYESFEVVTEENK